jgi:hypothetical protein
VNDSEILFLTTAIGTRWLFYQQFFLAQSFPLAKKVLIDGNNRWDFNLGLECVWYDFVRVAIRFNDRYKYFVYIDEDCFIFNRIGIVDAIKKIECHKVSLIGPADVVSGVRNNNPYALNSFLLIGKIADLKDIWTKYDLTLSFNKLVESGHVPEQKMTHEAEPYYNFFWNYRFKHLKIGFLSTSMNSRLKCTQLLCENGQVFGFHMWLTRNWNDNLSFHGIPNIERYKMVKKYLDKKYATNLIKVIASISMVEYLPIFFSRFCRMKFSRLKKRTKIFIKKILFR